MVGAHFPPVVLHDGIAGPSARKFETRFARGKDFLAHHAACLLRAFRAATRKLHHAHGDHLLRLERRQIHVESEFEPIAETSRSQAAILTKFRLLRRHLPTVSLVQRALDEIVQMRRLLNARETGTEGSETTLHPTEAFHGQSFAGSAGPSREAGE